VRRRWRHRRCAPGLAFHSVVRAWCTKRGAGRLQAAMQVRVAQSPVVAAIGELRALTKAGQSSTLVHWRIVSLCSGQLGCYWAALRILPIFGPPGRATSNSTAVLVCPSLCRIKAVGSLTCSKRS
jgi:hypothetical protein